MTRVVLSIGSNLGDRLARLQSVVDGLGEAVLRGLAGVRDRPLGRGGAGTVPQRGADRRRPGAATGTAWLRRAQEFERAAGRVRGQRWGPRTLDVDLIACYETGPSGAVEVHLPARAT